MIERPDAAALMAGPLGQWLAGQEAARTDARDKSARYTRNGVIGAAVLGLGALVLFRSIDAAMFGAMVPFGIGTFMAVQARKKVTDAIKGQINGAIASALGLEYDMAVTDRGAFDQAKVFSLLPDHDNDTLEDEWSGALGAQRFRLHEARLTQERGSGKSRRTVTVFEGTIMVISFGRRFLGNTLVERDQSRRSWFGTLKEAIELGGIQMQRIDMVDPRFEDTFTVWSNDPVEAHYLVHPEYVERLTHVEQSFAGKDIRALFSGGELLIVLETGNMFESGSLEASDDRDLLERTIDQFEALAALAAKLNERPR